MAYTNIDDPSAYFQTALYAGDSSNSTVITNDGNSDLQPDWVWIKSRNEGNAGTGGHMWFDSSRGIKSTTGSNSPFLVSNSTSGDQTNANGLQAIGTDSFTPGSMTRTNETGDNYAAWQWKANGGTTASNSNGSITSTVQANTTAGFSIVTYTGTGSAATVGHGLGVTPDMIIFKNRSGANVWATYHQGLGNNLKLELNSSNAQDSDGAFMNGTLPTSSVFSVGASANTNTGSSNYIAYCFNNVQGYSKFGKYVGNGNASGPFVYTGFKPAFVMIKVTSAVESWTMFDGARKPFNRDDNVASIYANTSGAEYTGASYHNIDILSNGFKVRLTNTAVNASGASYIYMAFAENPFTTSTGIPTTAR